MSPRVCGTAHACGSSPYSARCRAVRRSRVGRDRLRGLVVRRVRPDWVLRQVRGFPRQLERRRGHARPWRRSSASVPDPENRRSRVLRAGGHPGPAPDAIAPPAPERVRAARARGQRSGVASAADAHRVAPRARPRRGARSRPTPGPAPGAPGEATHESAWKCWRAKANACRAHASALSVRPCSPSMRASSPRLRRRRRGRPARRVARPPEPPPGALVELAGKKQGLRQARQGGSCSAHPRPPEPLRQRAERARQPRPHRRARSRRHG